MIIELGKASVETKGMDIGNNIDTAVGKVVKCEFVTT